jgi:hypothetical protein
MMRFYKYTVYLLAVTLFISSCRKDIDKTTVYPPVESDGIKFLDGLPNPSIGGVGSVVNVKVKGLKDKVGNFKFFIGDTEAEVLTVQDSIVSFRVPQDAISSSLFVKYQEKVFFGPDFKVRGKLRINPSFVAYTGAYYGSASGIVTDILPEGQDYILLGLFDNYQNLASGASPIKSMARISSTGQLVTGTNKMITYSEDAAMYNHITKLNNGTLMLSGSFNKYNKREGMNNITRLKTIQGHLDSMDIEVVNPDEVLFPKNSRDTVAAFNGGVLGSVVKTFVTADGNQLISVGNFAYYISYFYERSSRESKAQELRPINSVLRFNLDGSLDSTFNYNLVQHRGRRGVNGIVTDALQLPGGSIIIVGAFANYDNSDDGSVVPANRIVCINPTDGKINTTINNAFGAGADNGISKITYNATTKKILLTGGFNKFNNVTSNGVVMLNEDGTVNNTFKLQVLEGGIANYAGQLNDGRVVVTGSFTKYGGKSRPGIAILNADGTLAAGYNNVGAFEGQVNKMIETITPSGNIGLVLGGIFQRFDNTDVRSIIMLELLP